MYEFFDTLLSYIRGIWRFRWQMMVTAWVVSIVGWVAVMQLPDQYEASATVHVDTDTILRPLLRGLVVSTNPQQRVAMMTRTLITRPNLEKLARMTDLDLRAKTPEDMERLLDSLKKRLKITAMRRDNIYTISFVDPDRQLAKKVVQSLLTIFVETNLGRTREDTDVAQQFLEEQLKQYEKKLNEAEQRLADFKRRHVGMLPGGGQDYYARLENAMADLEAARLQLKELKNRRDAQLQQLSDLEESGSGGEESVLPQTSGMGASPYDARIQALQAQLDELMLRFTDKHPDVVELKRLIQDLEEKRQQEQATMVAEEDSESPLVQQLRVLLSETEAQMAAVQARVDAYEGRVKKLRELVDTLPKVETELKRLNRDYAVHKANYEQLLKRREQANISEQADVSADDVKFRVVEPPRVPLEPTGPPRVLYMFGVLLAAIGSGIAVAFVMFQINPAFDDAGTVKEITGMPVYGTVSMVYTPEMRRKRRFAFASFVAAGFGLLMLFGVTVLVEIMDLDIVEKLRGFRGI